MGSKFAPWHVQVTLSQSFEPITYLVKNYVKRDWRLFNIYIEEVKTVKTLKLCCFNFFFGFFLMCLQSFGKVI